MLRQILIIAILSFFFAPPAMALENDDVKAVILAYHRVGEPQNPQSNISIEQFDAHLDNILTDGYTVLPLDQIVKALKNKTPLPQKTIAITFEGGYRSAYKNAITKLIEHDLPFTIFIASENTKIPTHLNWRTLKKITKYDGAQFGILPAQYRHISDLTDQEITRIVNVARTDFKKHMGFEVEFFSYPYGEISSALMNIVQKQGFSAAFGQHSAPAHSGSNMLTLPRFTMTTQYADIDRFRMITNTLPLPATEIEPQDWKLNAPLTQIGFTLPQELEGQLDKLSCHISDQDKPTIEILANRIEIIPVEPINYERARLNCTLITQNNDEKQWRWLGMLFHTP